jgi:hypothetical protein
MKRNKQFEPTILTHSQHKWLQFMEDEFGF